jgi:hypothetical protein
MFNPRSRLIALAGASVAAPVVLADYFAVLTGVPDPLNAVRIAGFALIAIGMFYIFFRDWRVYKWMARP